MPLNTQPLAGASFGCLAEFTGARDAGAVVAAAEAEPDALTNALYAANGFLLMKGMQGITEEPALLNRLSRLFGEEVENYRETGMRPTSIHTEVPEILIVSNMPPVDRPPPKRPEPPLTADGKLPVQFPHRRGWHTDQSYRRPPPDISLFYATIPSPKGQGQTLYADCIAAYEALPSSLKAKVDDLVGIHVRPGSGRTEDAVRNGDTPDPLGPYEQPQHQPVVRTHPISGKRSLYLCEAGQMDWTIGPFVGMEPGPDGEGATLLYEIMSHLTQPKFVYEHEWDEGDLVIYDNRTTLHAATWFDAEKHGRLMWRTTISGNPGAEYEGERKSWLAAE
ncbi:MAG: TauD/TfdA family dioxygenase [Rhodospirillaceae bacterium]|nr:TauD/TfdA family dioxygenase [Rhodospirillaceae bacterium]